MYQDACFPSFTDSTVVFAKPPISPPANTPGSLVCIVSELISGKPHLLNLIGFIASTTEKYDRKIIKNCMRKKKKKYLNVLANSRWLAVFVMIRRP